MCQGENEHDKKPKLAIYEQGEVICLQRDRLAWTDSTIHIDDLAAKMFLREVQMYSNMAPATIHPFTSSTSIIKKDLVDLTSKWLHS